VTKKIIVAPLPCSEHQAGPQRIIEDRGELAILHPSGPVYNPAYFDVRAGEGNIRGRHYHQSKTETFYVISGHCRIRYLDLDTGEKGGLDVRQGDMVTILPHCAHQIEAVEFSQVIEFSMDEVDYAEDTVPYEIK
jgi:mannose-6-phosphate isomerase-like protein (cupin superfamily)